jgi:hypothetical protein
MNNPFGLGVFTPSPYTIVPNDIQNTYSNASQQVNQNLNQVFQLQNPVYQQ